LLYFIILFFPLSNKQFSQESNADEIITKSQNQGEKLYKGLTDFSFKIYSKTNSYIIKKEETELTRLREYYFIVYCNNLDRC